MKIYIWGTGCGAGELLDSGIEIEKTEGFIDSFPSGKSFMGKPVFLPEELPADDYFIVVASRHSGEIASKCRELGLDMSRVLFLRNHYVLTDLNSSYKLAGELLGEKTVERLQENVRIVPTPEWTASELLDEKDLENDWVRISSLVQTARRLEGLKGAAAELGVYRGDFARCINALMPGRRLYLFDSFEGFDASEAGREGKAGSGFAEAHKNTSAELVMKRMPHPEKVIIKPGLFPESAEGVNESFAFVSLDADLEDSSYAGLLYFYPRLVHGGVIFVHDYGSGTLPGVRAAVERYENVLGKKLHAAVLPDVNGTLMIF